jgi:hypothetical protein
MQSAIVHLWRDLPFFSICRRMSANQGTMHATECTDTIHHHSYVCAVTLSALYWHRATSLHIPIVLYIELLLTSSLIDFAARINKSFETLIDSIATHQQA